jgi:alpha-glucosidase
MSGISNSGHDIGGFAGPVPTAELLVRWVSAGIFLPRFSIHSWKENGIVTSPWMYESCVDDIRDLMSIRVMILPYLYHLLWRYHQYYELITRPMFVEFPSDFSLLNEDSIEDVMMLGPLLMVALVCEPGNSRKNVKTPIGYGDWVYFWSGEIIREETIKSFDSDPSRPIMLFKIGSVIPINIGFDMMLNAEHDHTKTFGWLLFPHSTYGTMFGEAFCDDGYSTEWKACPEKYIRTISLTVTPEYLRIDCLKQFGNDSIRIVLGKFECRNLIIADLSWKIISDEIVSFMGGKRVITLNVSSEDPK